MGSSAASQQEASADHFAIRIRRCAEPTKAARAKEWTIDQVRAIYGERPDGAWLATSAAVAGGLALGASAAEAFGSSLAPASREIGAWLLVRPNDPMLVSVLCSPMAEQTVSALAMHVAWNFPPGLREAGQLRPAYAPGWLSRQHV